MDIEGSTPLTHALLEGHHKVALILIMAGASFDYQDSKSWTRTLFSQDWQHQVALLLIKADTSLDYQDSEGFAPLAHASMGGHHKVASLLIRAGASLNLHDMKGQTVISYAAKQHSCGMAYLLPKNCAVARPTDRQARTPLRPGVLWPEFNLSGEYEPIKFFNLLLLHNGNSVNTQDEGGQTPLVWTLSKYSSHFSCLLLDRVRLWTQGTTTNGLP
ncbi:ankyrin repeat-containing domain protein [Pterulicium gracile]|uniref:Ankyrin repeat-containing domain protein n=1 Tax=Pterulicium gracile TaxID=1884261 RepID=A0A5C3PZY0_9AGAR|nr:ankyrin repeat-containing domain protein [Pterula gracilis]